MVPQALSVNAAATVLEALLAYDITMVPLALLVHATTTVPQASSVNTTTMVPQASSANAGAMVPLALSANALTSMDIEAANMSTFTIMEADKKATAEIYS